MARKAANPGVGTGHGTRTRREFTCIDCGSAFLASRSDALRCKRCGEKRYETFESRHRGTCTECGAPVVRRSSFCRKCASKYRSSNQPGAAHPSWKGGRVQWGGYIHVKVGTEYVPEHRLVWEQAHGPIPEGYEVHHLNGIRTDNRLENLMALTRKDHHTQHAAYEDRIRQLEARVRELESAM